MRLTRSLRRFGLMLALLAGTTFLWHAENHHHARPWQQHACALCTLAIATPSGPVRNVNFVAVFAPLRVAMPTVGFHRPYSAAPSSRAPPAA